MNFKVLSAILAIGIPLGVAQGDEGEAHEHHLSEWKFGGTLFGDRVVPSKLDGRVVVLEYWGVGCSSCVKGLGNLADLDEKYRSKGVVIIGAEVCGSGAEKIGGVLEDKKVKFSVTDRVTGPISVSDLPYAVVFGPDGKMIYHGHPNDEKFETVIGKAVGDVENIEKVAQRVGERIGAVNLVEQRTWKNGEGKPLIAALRKVEGDKVYFLLTDGREIPYEIDRLSQGDQEFVKKIVRNSVNLRK